MLIPALEIPYFGGRGLSNGISIVQSNKKHKCFPRKTVFSENFFAGNKIGNFKE